MAKRIALVIALLDAYLEGGRTSGAGIVFQYGVEYHLNVS